MIFCPYYDFRGQNYDFQASLRCTSICTEVEAKFIFNRYIFVVVKTTWHTERGCVFQLFPSMGDLESWNKGKVNGLRRNKH